MRLTGPGRSAQATGLRPRPCPSTPAPGLADPVRPTKSAAAQQSESHCVEVSVGGKAVQCASGTLTRRSFHVNPAEIERPDHRPAGQRTHQARGFDARKRRHSSDNFACRLLLDSEQEHGLRALGPIAEVAARSEEHTSELQSHSELVCRLLLQNKKSLSRLRL